MQTGKDIAVKFPGLFLVHHNIPGSQAPHHEHPEHHLIIPLQGEISVEVEGKMLTCGPGAWPMCRRALSQAIVN